MNQFDKLINITATAGFKSQYDFDKISAPSLWDLISPQDEYTLYNIAKNSTKYKPLENRKAIDAVMYKYGYKRMGAGTNRLVYRIENDTRYVLKVAIDSVGLTDNPKEYRNQQFLKPWVTKVFEVSPSGVIALTERVTPITNRKQFYDNLEAIFTIITFCLLGKYIMADIGAKYFMNWGIRDGWGPVLLDYPYLYELDGEKLICNKEFPNGFICGGIIDYDDGVDELVCTKCGKQYSPTQLAKNIKNKMITSDAEGESTMRCCIMQGEDIVARGNIDETIQTTSTIELPDRPMVNTDVEEDTDKVVEIVISFKDDEEPTPVEDEEPESKLEVYIAAPGDIIPDKYKEEDDYTEVVPESIPNVEAVYIREEEPVEETTQEQPKVYIDENVDIDIIADELVKDLPHSSKVSIEVDKSEDSKVEEKEDEAEERPSGGILMQSRFVKQPSKYENEEYDVDSMIYLDHKSKKYVKESKHENFNNKQRIHSNKKRKNSMSNMMDEY